MRSPWRGVAQSAIASCLGVVCALALGACSPGEVRAPNPTRTLDERRAIEVIRRALKEDGVEPALARDIKLVTGKEIHVDVGVQGHEFGIVYVSPEDAQKLGNAIPPPNKKDERLRLVHAGENGETRLVLLYQDTYLYDDLAGEAHEQTAITCEQELARDVHDFITHAQAQKYK